ncbi:MAG: hypothetical protein Q7U66_14820 [Methylobacter sp.]|nr:hypothetical protein [Methylobacter sp.]
MNILSEIEAAGLVVSLAGDRLEISNPSRLTAELKNLMIANKQEIIKQLSGTQLQQDIREQIEERAAIMEYDGGLTRRDAEAAATAAIRVYCYRMKDKPTTELTVIMPGTELTEALEKMRNKYGDRLLDVYPSPYCIAGILVNTTKH